MDANTKAKHIFNREQDPKYMPHLSLVYGNFDDDVKKKIISEIGSRIEIVIDVKNIHLFLSEDKPEKWSRVREFPLT